VWALASERSPVRRGLRPMPTPYQVKDVGRRGFVRLRLALSTCWPAQLLAVVVARVFDESQERTTEARDSSQPDMMRKILVFIAIPSRAECSKIE